MTVPEYCVEEVERQGHDILELDGIQRVGWMLDAWAYALTELKLGRLHPVVHDVIQIGNRVERHKNALGVRSCNVYVGNRPCPEPKHIARLLVDLFESLRDGDYVDDSIGFYKDFEEIHPFEDGNGRTGKVLLNWVNGSLYRPIFPPANLWGRPILNP